MWQLPETEGPCRGMSTCNRTRPTRSWTRRRCSRWRGGTSPARGPCAGSTRPGARRAPTPSTRALASAGVARELPVAPAEVARRALAALPPSDVRVALHSNPAPEHTFVDPASGAYTGTIDFGDAYISHPALDLRRWRDPADREAL